MNIKRIYDSPSESDGRRILVDRLWPRGVSKENARIDEWYKDLTPSTELRKWFHEDVKKRFDEFEKKYQKELDESEPAQELKQEIKEKHTTLVTSVKDIEHSHIPTLIAFLQS